MVNFAISTTKSQVLSRNGGRKYLLLVNQAADYVLIAFANQDITTAGIRIDANGVWEIPTTTFQAIPPDSFLFQSVQAVLNSGTGVLLVVEA